ncbi:hypothetical protein HU200_025034 [Digitaria exilis]|uniref:IMS import disulfide relay-system CHCH-CHCH-like Cx9C domain-containing protein n=1 Tax=Digitaria exilis TaxID=1010633 RepID=A0A835CAP5_9POAL|nr:hypothetical protein HU200_025034 [Digitaria exilis]
MGRKAGALYINPKKFGAVAKPCMVEMVAFLNCLALNKQEDDKCLKQKDLLVMCTQTQLLMPICDKIAEREAKERSEDHKLPSPAAWARQVPLGSMLLRSFPHQAVFLVLRVGRQLLSSN